MINKIKKIFCFKAHSFQSDIDNFNVINNDKAEFIYQNCREYLINSVDNLKILQSKVVLILGFIFSVIFFSISRIITIKTAQEKNCINEEFALFLVFLVITYLLIAVILVIFAFYPKGNAVSGNEPKELIFQKFLNQEISIIKIVESENYQQRIDINIFLSERIAWFIRTSLLVMIFSTLIIGIGIFGFHNWFFAICK